MQKTIEIKWNKFGQLLASFTLTIAATLISTAASACQPASSSSPQSEQATQAEPKEGEWRTISPQDALATFRVPKKPRYVERTFTPVANKPPIKVHLYMSTVNEGKATYVFGYHDLHEYPPKKARDRILDGAVRGSVVNVEGKLLSDVTRIRFKQHPGRQFYYQYEHTEKLYKVLSRVFLVGKRQYQVSSVALESEFNEALATEFLNSFKLVIIENDEPPVPRTLR